MEKKKKKFDIKTMILFLSLIVFLSASVFTFAFFTDSKSYSGDLTFGSLELDVSGGVSGDGVDSATSKLVFDVTRTSGPAYSTTKKVMPGDTININLTIGLKDGSEPAYYMVSITDDNNVFEDATYFSENGKVYVFDARKTYLQTDSTKTAVTDKFCGKLTAGTSGRQSLKIPAVVSQNFEEQNAKANIKCTVSAIQQANLAPSDAKTKLIGMNLGIDTNKYNYVNYIESPQRNYSYINTGIAPTSKMKFVGKMYCQRPTTGTDNYLFGSGSSYSNFTGLMIPMQDSMYIGLGDRTSYVVRSVEQQDYYDIDFDFEYGTNYAKLNSNIANYNVTFDSITLNTDDFRIFCNAGGNGVWLSRVYRFKMYDNGVLVRNYIPCLRTADNKPGLYDLVSNEFFINAHTSGEFAWG